MTTIATQTPQPTALPAIGATVYTTVGNVLTFTLDRIVPDPSKTLRQGAIRPWAGSWKRIFWPRLQKCVRCVSRVRRRASSFMKPTIKTASDEASWITTGMRPSAPN